jgi:poly-gamma-glutamate synthesis protein (capsule biosynthesis protein)
MKKYFFSLLLTLALLASACSDKTLNTNTRQEADENPLPVLVSSPSPSPTPAPTPSPSPTPAPTPTPAPPIVLAFAGDINLDDSWSTMQFLAAQENGLADCLSPSLLERMRSADIFLLNNEFAISDRGAPLENKLYTFRAKPENVAYLLEMGVDIVSLANNHAFDYGAEAFFDTLEYLSAAEIRYIGAGRDLDEAMSAQYFTINDLTIAYVAASRAEKYILTPQASATSPGILRTYDSALFLEAVERAKANADIVIAYVHWGTEYSYVLEEAQTTLARELIDNGADLVIGAHPHCLQGIEYYNDKPIIYSLGNLWFNDRTLATVLLEVTITSPTEIILTIEPCLQANYRTELLSDYAGRREVFDLLMDISPRGEVWIDDEGVVHQQ